jgi:nucleoside 2-deoxyribosyltransferase
MYSMTPLRIYLAGPDVFLPDAATLFTAKRQLCADYGFVGVAPVDSETDLSMLPKRAAALQISADNEDLIRSCDLLIANLTPFRGPSADVGTAYEIGFARALGLPVHGYSNVAGNLLERTRAALEEQIKERPAGGFEDADRMLIEDFDGTDNLMLDGAVEASGTQIVINPVLADRRFVDLAGFEACLKLAAEQFSVGKSNAAPGEN